ncbi:MAG: prolipoprotein diacylglyceryl transferase [Deltaproteobacteria bacterium]|nr:prolipoprotein diacylglyceryl transferase [Deltaproteobacteria bacterium]
MRPYIFRLPEWLGSIPDWVPLIGGVQLGGRPLFAYGVMLGLSFLLGWVLSTYFIERLNQDRRKAQLMFIVASIGAIAGARLLYFIASAPEKLSLLNFFRFQEGGLVAYGGFVGGIVVAAVAAPIIKADYWGMADAVAPALALGTGITRLGCFLFGCDFGNATDGWWALRFPHWSNPGVSQWIPKGAPAFSQHFHGMLDQTGELLSHAVYPTQLLLSLKGFTAFVLVMLLLPFRRFHGEVLLAFLVYYALARFLVEFLRGDAIRGTTTLGLPFSTSQLAAGVVVAVAIPLWGWLRSRARRDPSRG